MNSFLSILFIVIVPGESRSRILALSPPHVISAELPQGRWFTQTLDHFNPTDLRTWHQRYYVNDTYFKGSKDAPVFIMIGGEGEASAKWMVSGAWIEYAKIFGALCFQLEHRFYGMSRPTKDMSLKNLVFLNSEQALADLANFIVSIIPEYNLGRENKWIAFGGSYPGSLAAWLRYKYPHLVHAAISSSGPLLAVADFKEYNEIVRASLGSSSSECVTAVRMANKHLTKLFSDPTGGDLLTKYFRLCKTLNVTNELDRATFSMVLADIFAGVVQYNKDNRMTEDPTSKITIDDLCSVMKDANIGNPLQRYAKVNTMMLQLSNETCLNFTYTDMIQELKNITWSSNEKEADRQWLYQTCVEFGFYQTSSSENELFGPNFPLEYYIRQCADIYGESFGRELLDLGINRTNTIYGDIHLKVKRVLFVHGSIDPWHALGLISSRNPETPAIFIKGTAHCANMYPSRESDLPQLKEARKIITQQLKRWLQEDD